MKKFLAIAFVVMPMTLSLTKIPKPSIRKPRIRKVEPIQAKPIEQNELVFALIQVESSGNHRAHNVPEDAVGCLQIRRVMVKEVNRILRRIDSKDRYDMNDRWDCDLSKEMFNIWRDYHHSDSDYETIARNWNGGPRGYQLKATERYWKKVQDHLESK